MHGTLDIAPNHMLSRAQELGELLRRRRETLDPVRLGLSRVGRVRTPGLRREEVAARADIGITWYTKLEQGRPIRVSPRVLLSVAQALEFNEVETEHLFRLANLPVPPRLDSPQVCKPLTAAIQHILDQLCPYPALIQTQRYNIRGFNEAYRRLVGVDLHAIPAEDRNCIYLSLVNPAWRASQADPDEMLAHMAALFRASMAEHLDDPVWERQLERYMSASDQFRIVWDRYQLKGIENAVKRFRLADGTILALQSNNWWASPSNDDRMIVYTPVDEVGAERLKAMMKRRRAC
ncbi:helix-turn-helix transcriptional regulator [Rhizobium sp. CNPSo 3968]|uniref:helix-turn-helix transcriptional regulator n=1 Tax=Rhizobium sp. CNPSo 3968 TaxID=3021408 RepID=UPI00254AED24|nr:helix-turn-helix transcriptional regulator [Rhizobium sp. CNPSo 3968]MDK4718483.1 helix-turn-helix transcriptional regulator [Rhizobium sp. CNPSo 3968]